MAVKLRASAARTGHRGRRLAAALATGALFAAGVMTVQAANPMVEPAPTADARDLWLEAEIDPPTPYVQAQAVYTLRLFQAIAVRELRFHPPQAPLADIRPLSDEHVFELTRDGRRLRVTERRYAVFPFASGEIALPGAGVTGEVAVPGATPAATRALRLAPPAAPLRVRPIPASTGNAGWLPARALTVSETWTPDPATARTGEALRRTLRIEATGVDAAQLPALDPAGDGYSAHAEAPRLDNRLDGAWNTGIREQSWLIVPSRAGTLEVPALRLPWWDVLADKPRVAGLPARTLVVAAAADAAQPLSPTPVSGPDDAATRGPAPPAVTPAATPDARHPIARPAAIALAGAAALALAAWAGNLLRRRTAPWRALRRACRRNDPHAAQRALLRWAATRWPDAPPRSVGELAQRMPGTAAAAALAELERRLYGPAPARWDGRALPASLRSRRAPRRGRPAPLPPLHDTCRRASATDDGQV